MVKTKLAARQKNEIDVEAIKASIRNIPDFPKPGILFRDITPLLGNPAIFQKTIELLAGPYQKTPPDYIVGIEARGFILAAPVAQILNCGFVPVRKPKKLPSKTISVSYSLEYGQDAIEIHADAFSNGKNVVIVDDVLATGGTAWATAQLVEKAGGKVAGISFLIELAALKGNQKLGQYPIHSLIKF